MARGTDPVADPRWEGQDSLSLPNRPAHPDPSLVAQDDPDTVAVHGIVGFTEAKHGITPEAEVRRNLQRNEDARRAELEAERDSVRATIDTGGDPDGTMKARLKGVEASLKSAPRASGSEEEQTVAQSLAEAVQAGDVVPSTEQTSDGEDGKRTDVQAANAPVEKKE